jgi:hypothetical protein
LPPWSLWLGLREVADLAPEFSLSPRFSRALSFSRRFLIGRVTPPHLKDRPVFWARSRLFCEKNTRLPGGKGQSVALKKSGRSKSGRSLARPRQFVPRESRPRLEASLPRLDSPLLFPAARGGYVDLERFREREARATCGRDPAPPHLRLAAHVCDLVARCRRLAVHALAPNGDVAGDDRRHVWAPGARRRRTGESASRHLR